MKKRLLFGQLYSIGIFICVVVGYQYGILRGNYIMVAGAALIIAIFVIQKIKIFKEIRNTQKPPTK